MNSAVSIYPTIMCGKSAITHYAPNEFIERCAEYNEMCEEIDGHESIKPYYDAEFYFKTKKDADDANDLLTSELINVLNEVYPEESIAVGRCAPRATHVGKYKVSMHFVINNCAVKTAKDIYLFDDKTKYINDILELFNGSCENIFDPTVYKNKGCGQKFRCLFSNKKNDNGSYIKYYDNGRDYAYDEILTNESRAYAINRMLITAPQKIQRYYYRTEWSTDEFPVVVPPTPTPSVCDTPVPTTSIQSIPQITYKTYEVNNEVGVYGDESKRVSVECLKEILNCLTPDYKNETMPWTITVKGCLNLMSTYEYDDNEQYEIENAIVRWSICDKYPNARDIQKEVDRIKSTLGNKNDARWAMVRRNAYNSDKDKYVKVLKKYGLAGDQRSADKKNKEANALPTTTDEMASTPHHKRYICDFLSNDWVPDTIDEAMHWMFHCTVIVGANVYSFKTGHGWVPHDEEQRCSNPFITDCCTVSIEEITMKNIFMNLRNDPLYKKHRVVGSLAFVPQTWQPEESERIIYNGVSKSLNTFVGFGHRKLESREHRTDHHYRWFLDQVLGTEQATIMWKTMAEIVQNPSAKAGTSIVLYAPDGGEGKTTIGDMFAALFGQYADTNTKASAITGHFNGDLENKVFLVCNELPANAFKETDDVMKSLITEIAQKITNKFQNTKTRNNYSHFLFTTNNRDAINFSSSNRRFIVLRASTTLVGNTDAFTMIHDEMKNKDILETVWNDLYNEDLNGFNSSEAKNGISGLNGELNEETLCALTRLPTTVKSFMRSLFEYRYNTVKYRDSDDCTAIQVDGAYTNYERHMKEKTFHQYDSEHTLNNLSFSLSLGNYKLNQFKTSKRVSKDDHRRINTYAISINTMLSLIQEKLRNNNITIDDLFDTVGFE